MSRLIAESVGATRWEKKRIEAWKKNVKKEIEKGNIRGRYENWTFPEPNDLEDGIEIIDNEDGDVIINYKYACEDGYYASCGSMTISWNELLKFAPKRD